jgi:SAM-dependent methyltransferase
MSTITGLSPDAAQRTSGAVPVLFDMSLRAMRRDRAARVGPELFLYERAFDDCLERLSLMERSFGRALLIGCPDAEWPARLANFTDDIAVVDPGPLFAHTAGGDVVIEDEWRPAAIYDLILAVGTLDTVNDLPRALMAIRSAILPGGLFMGVLSGGDTLPQLRAAMHEADRIAGAASPHVHPRIEASALAPLLDRCGFAEPVVDVDRVQVSYSSLIRLVADLRAMAATNLLIERSRQPLSKAAAAAAAAKFNRADGERTIETFELLHFSCRAAELGRR